MNISLQLARPNSLETAVIAQVKFDGKKRRLEMELGEALSHVGNLDCDVLVVDCLRIILVWLKSHGFMNGCGVFDCR